jgi:hypothetical protein
VVEWWSGGVVEGWSGGGLEWWRVGVWVGWLFWLAVTGPASSNGRIWNRAIFGQPFNFYSAKRTGGQTSHMFSFLLLGFLI